MSQEKYGPSPGSSHRISDGGRDQRISPHTDSVLLPHSQNGHKKRKHRRKPTFNLEPEYIPAGPSHDSDTPNPKIEMSEEEAADFEAKEVHRKRVKRIVAAVGITLTVICVVLVGLSLSLGQKIDELVGAKSVENSNTHQYSGNDNEFYLGPAPTPSNTSAF